MQSKTIRKEPHKVLSDQMVISQKPLTCNGSDGEEEVISKLEYTKPQINIDETDKQLDSSMMNYSTVFRDYPLG